MNVRISKEVKWILIGVFVMVLGSLLGMTAWTGLQMLGVFIGLAGLAIEVAAVGKTFMADLFPEREYTEEEQRERLRRGMF